MSVHMFDESNYETFDANKLVIEVSKTNVGQYHVSFFSIKYASDDGAVIPIKVKTPALTTPFGANINQFGKLQLTLSVPVSPFHEFIGKLQTAIKEYICSHIKMFDENYKSTKMDLTTFEILSTSFDILKHRDDGKYDDTIIFDMTNEMSQKMIKVFDKTKHPIHVSFKENESDYISEIIPAHSELRVSFRINSICMYGEIKQRKYVIKKDINHILLISTATSSGICDFGEAEDEAGSINEDGFADF